MLFSSMLVVVGNIYIPNIENCSQSLRLLTYRVTNKDADVEPTKASVTVMSTVCLTLIMSLNIDVM